jgi:hypothetical protein
MAGKNTKTVKGSASPGKKDRLVSGVLGRELAKDLPTEEQKREGLSPDELNTRNDQ